jgi:hypothetical protein
LLYCFEFHKRLKNIKKVVSVVAYIWVSWLLACKHVELLTYPSFHFISPITFWPRYTIVSPFDLTICGSICWEMVDEQAYGNILCAFVMRVNTLTLYTWAKIFSDLCECYG